MFKFVIVVVLFSECFFVADSIFGPSLISLTARDFTLLQIIPSRKSGNSTLIHVNSLRKEDSGRKVLLKDYPHFAVVLPLENGRVSASPMEVWKGTLGYMGFVGRTARFFTVEAPKDHGIMAVVQELDLRVGSRSGYPCNDYIKFGDENGKSTEICGKIESGDNSISPQHLIGPRVFSTSTGNMTVTFNPSLTSFLDSSTPFLRVAIAFTAYKEGCYFNETEDFNPNTYRACALRGWQSSCIKSDLFCDNGGIINCGNENEFGSDESNCSQTTTNVFLNNLLNNHPPSNNEWEPSYTFYSNYTSAVIGIIGFFTCFFLIVLLVSKTCRFKRRKTTVQYNENNIHITTLPIVNTSTHLNRHSSSQYDSDIVIDRPPSYRELFPNTS